MHVSASTMPSVSWLLIRIAARRCRRYVTSSVSSG